MVTALRHASYQVSRLYQVESGLHSVRRNPVPDNSRNPLGFRMRKLHFLPGFQTGAMMGEAETARAHIQQSPFDHLLGLPKPDHYLALCRPSRFAAMIFRGGHTGPNGDIVIIEAHKLTPACPACSGGCP